MSEQQTAEREEIQSKVMRAGRRTYFFDVRETRAGDYYLTVTESKKFTNEDGSFYYKKHKIYLYKEDFQDFQDNLEQMMNFIVDEKGEEVISERHQKNFNKEEGETVKVGNELDTDVSDFTDISFDDI